ncbi:hypothetical protein [Bacillus manliponensis]|uniref:hypothetical protein n=1 Tax=Bacillus manliponensis TaxID=574376 RepID=UPI0035179CE3
MANTTTAFKIVNDVLFPVKLNTQEELETVKKNVLSRTQALRHEKRNYMNMLQALHNYDIQDVGELAAIYGMRIVEIDLMCFDLNDAIAEALSEVTKEVK